MKTVKKQHCNDKINEHWNLKKKKTNYFVVKSRSSIFGASLLRIKAMVSNAQEAREKKTLGWNFAILVDKLNRRRESCFLKADALPNTFYSSTLLKNEWKIVKPKFRFPLSKHFVRKNRSTWYKKTERSFFDNFPLFILFFRI